MASHIDITQPHELGRMEAIHRVESKGNERGGLEFQYQVFSSGP